RTDRVAVCGPQQGPESRRRLVRPARRAARQIAPEESNRPGGRPEGTGPGPLWGGGYRHSGRFGREDAEGAQGREQGGGNRAVPRHAARLPRRLSAELSQGKSRRWLETIARLVQETWRGVESWPLAALRA